MTALLCVTALPGLASAQQGNHKPDGLTRQQVQRMAREIDSLVDAGLRAHQVRANPRSEDSTFLRRAYLDVIGRIPTPAEARSFLDSRDSDRRADLIDHLLASRGHASHMFNYWADLLRAKSRLSGGVSGEPYVHWIKQSVAEGKPYDRWVSELLRASGPAHERGNGATGYYLRDRGMPEDNMANTVRVFLGTRLECAQCHNHPFDKWTQKQFFEMAAFTGGIQYRNEDFLESADGERFKRFGRELREGDDRNAYRAFRQIVQQANAGIAGNGTGLARLPDNYQYDDATAEQLVAATTMFGGVLDPPVIVPDESDSRRRSKRRGSRRRGRDRHPQLDTRAALAEWMTSPQNPRFTMVIANRMWKRLMGRGVIEPVDLITDATQPSNPELMSFLEKLMVEVDYDLREFQRVVLYTKGYQRAASRAEPGEGETYHFPGPMLRRLTAEQLWDSLMTLVVADLDEKLDAPDEKAKTVYDRYADFTTQSDEDLLAVVERRALRYSDPERYREMVAMERDEERAQRSEESQRHREDMQEKADELRDLRRRLRRAQRDKDPVLVTKLREKIEAAGGEFKSRTRKRAQRDLKRASDMRSPASSNHFLREFGQSDREQIEAAHTDANVPQALALLNGIADRYLLHSGSELRRILGEADSDRAVIETAYLALLCREPTRGELAMWKRDLADDEAQGLRDLVWALANTDEFRFIQ